MTKNQNGALQIFLLITLMTFCIGGFGIWSYFRKWRLLAATQIRLDRCIGKAAQDFRTTLNLIESYNLQIQGLRASIQAAEAYPALVPPLQAALLAVVSLQEVEKYKWEAKRVKWIITRGCGKWTDQARKLPDLEYQRDPPDSVGPQTLEWPGEMPEEFFFQIQNPPRYAAALVTRSENGLQTWKAKWTVPKKLSGTDFY